MTTKTEDEGPRFEPIEGAGDGKIPVPEHVEKDDDAVEICRVWKLGDESISNVTSPYELENPGEWGVVLAGIARSLAGGMARAVVQERGGDDAKIAYLERAAIGAIITNFLGKFGIRLLIVPGIEILEPDEPVLDPDKAN